MYTHYLKLAAITVLVSVVQDPRTIHVIAINIIIITILPIPASAQYYCIHALNMCTCTCNNTLRDMQYSC